MPRRQVAVDVDQVLPDSDLNPDGSIHIDGPYDSVWDALESDLGERERMKMLSYLMMLVGLHIREQGWTKRRAARIMGVTPPRITALTRGNINLFTIDDMVMMAGKAGLQLSVGLKPPKA